MQERTVCILGGTGFVGSWMVTRLVDAGYQVRIPTRHAHRARHLRLLPTAQVIEANVYDPDTLEGLVSGCAAAINLVGILNERGRDGSGFRKAHVELPERLIAACQARGVTRLLHMSALHADAHGGLSHYLRTKGEAEALVHAAPNLETTSFRSSVIFGPGDSFFNRFAKLLRLTPWIFPLACPESRFAPIYVDDVASAFVHALDNPATIGQRYDLCGPQIFTLRELVAYASRQIGKRHWILGLSDGLSKLQARLLEFVPGKPMSLDNYHSLQTDSICSGPIAEELGVVPTAIDSVVPQYLGRRSQRASYDALRQVTRRG